MQIETKTTKQAVSKTFTAWKDRRIMKLKEVKIKNYKRFSDLTIWDIPSKAHLIMLVGPNGCGKSSFIDALYTWYKRNSKKSMDWDEDYHSKVTSPLKKYYDNVTVEFHDPLPEDRKKILYVRTAHRNDPDFRINSIARSGNLLDYIPFQRMIDNDAAVSKNYQRLVGQGLEDLYEYGDSKTTFKQYREEHIGEIRKSMQDLFSDLRLDSLGNPLEFGTFKFTKGKNHGFMFKNLSGGEKAAFDLILDITVARRSYDNTIFCIDEPDIHVHTRLQAKMLSILDKLVPENCQLILASHSIGMMRKAMEIEHNNPGSVAFLDFSSRDFDESQTIVPAKPDRVFWKKAYEVALGDLSGLIAPKQVIICEGAPAGRLSTKHRSIDAQCYNHIFSNEFPETEFVSLGNDNEVMHDRYGLAATLRQILNATNVVRLIDRDDRTDETIEQLANEGVRVLSRRNLESYLFDDEVLCELANEHGESEKCSEIIDEKTRILSNSNDRVRDNLKPVCGEIYNACKKSLDLVQTGNDTEEFMVRTLSPLVKQNMEIYKILKHDIFNV